MVFSWPIKQWGDVALIADTHGCLNLLDEISLWESVALTLPNGF